MLVIWQRWNLLNLSILFVGVFIPRLDCMEPYLLRAQHIPRSPVSVGVRHTAVLFHSLIDQIYERLQKVSTKEDWQKG